jgi:hypothetical protein
MESTSLIRQSKVTINNVEYKYFNRKKIIGNPYKKADEVYQKREQERLENGIISIIPDNDRDDWVLRNCFMRAFHRMAIAHGWSQAETEEVLLYASKITSEQVRRTGEFDNQLYLDYLSLYFTEGQEIEEEPKTEEPIIKKEEEEIPIVSSILIQKKKYLDDVDKFSARIADLRRDIEAYRAKYGIVNNV